MKLMFDWILLLGFAAVSQSNLIRFHLQHFMVDCFMVVGDFKLAQVSSFRINKFKVAISELLSRICLNQTPLRETHTHTHRVKLWCHQSISCHYLAEDCYCENSGQNTPDTKNILDSHLKNILENVRLNYLLERDGSGWDGNLNWEDILSLGEQQRLGMVSQIFTITFLNKYTAQNFLLFDMMYSFIPGTPILSQAQVWHP